jgi:hypothetical protein
VFKVVKVVAQQFRFFYKDYRVVAKRTDRGYVTGYQVNFDFIRLYDALIHRVLFVIFIVEYIFAPHKQSEQRIQNLELIRRGDGLVDCVDKHRQQIRVGVSDNMIHKAASVRTYANLGRRLKGMVCDYGQQLHLRVGRHFQRQILEDLAVVVENKIVHLHNFDVVLAAVRLAIKNQRKKCHVATYLLERRNRGHQLAIYIPLFMNLKIQMRIVIFRE